MADKNSFTEILRVNKEFEALKKDFNERVSISNNKDVFNEYGFKFLDFVISINTGIHYDASSRETMMQLLLVIKDFVNTLGIYHEYLNTTAMNVTLDNKVSSVISSDVKVEDAKENTNDGAGIGQGATLASNEKAKSLVKASPVAAHALTEEKIAA